MGMKLSKPVIPSWTLMKIFLYWGLKFESYSSFSAMI